MSRNEYVVDQGQVSLLNSAYISPIDPELLSASTAAAQQEGVNDTRGSKIVTFDFLD
jgi:hypothetical protein